MPKISVIVPVYNVEKYLNRCVDSILSQAFTDFELILVDDGSPDNSGKICDEYKEKDSRVVVIHKENGGVSAARNDGIKIAKGEYVVFIDSDDYVKEKYLEELLHEDIDFVCQPANDYSEDGRLIGILGNNSEAEFFNINEAVIDKMLSEYRCNTVWAKLFRKNVIIENNIFFDENMNYGEDTLFSVKCLKYSKTLIIDTNVNYCYIRYNSRSTLSNNDEIYKLDINLLLWHTICDVLYFENKKKYNIEFVKKVNYLYNKILDDNFKFLLIKNYNKNLRLLLKMQKDKDFLLCLKYGMIKLIDDSIKNEILSGSKSRIVIKYTYLQIKQCRKELIKK